MNHKKYLLISSVTTA